MRLARISRPDAIYDASAAAQNLPTGNRMLVLDVPKPNDFERMPGFKDFLLKNSKRGKQSEFIQEAKERRYLENTFHGRKSFIPKESNKKN